MIQAEKAAFDEAEKKNEEEVTLSQPNISPNSLSKFMRISKTRSESLVSSYMT